MCLGPSSSSTYFECEIFLVSESVVAEIAAISIVSIIVEIFTAAAAISNQWTTEPLWREIVWSCLASAVAWPIESIISKVIVLLEVVVASVFVWVKWALLSWPSSAIIPVGRILRWGAHYH